MKIAEVGNLIEFKNGLQGIVEKVNESKVSNPAVIIVGDVVGLHPEYVEAYVGQMKF